MYNARDGNFRLRIESVSSLFVLLRTEEEDRNVAAGVSLSMQSNSNGASTDNNDTIYAGSAVRMLSIRRPLLLVVDPDDTTRAVSELL